MASIRKHPKSTFWYACFTDSNGVRTTRSTKSKNRNAALKMAVEWEKAASLASEGRLTEAQARTVINSILEHVGQESVTFYKINDWFEEWVEGKRKSSQAATYKKYQPVVCRFLKHLGAKAEMGLASLTPTNIRSFRDLLSKEGRAARTVNHIVSKILSAPLSKATALGYMPINPCKAVEPLKEETTEAGVFSLEQIANLLKAAPSNDWKDKTRPFRHLQPTHSNMGSEWRDVALEDVADELTVGYVGPMASEYVDDGVPFLRSLNVEPLRINKNDLKFITPEFHQRIQKSRLTPGDVVIVRTGKPGACSVVPDWLADANCSDLVIVRCGKHLNNRFLAYYVNTVASGHVAAHLVGAVQQHFNVGSARTLRINLPPLPEQKAIAHILGTLDDKIAKNTQLNHHLEEMARALFKSWFVDFDPVRAKLDGCPPAGLDEATAALFPPHFQESEAGHIPQGWTVEPVGQVVECVGGGTPSTAESKYWDGGTHHWTTPKDFSSLQAPVLLDTDRKITDAGIAKISSGLLPAGTLLLSSRAPVGYLAIAAIPVAINQGFIAMKCNGRASNFFMLNWCHENMAEIEGRATGTTFAEISKQNFRPIPVVLPPKELMAVFTAKVAPLYDQITANLHQSRTLAALRDTLLPKLLSGELSVADAER